MVIQDTPLLNGKTVASLFAHVTGVEEVMAMRHDTGTEMATMVQDEQFLYVAKGDGGLILADGFYEKDKDGNVEGSTHYLYLASEEVAALHDFDKGELTS